MSALDWLRRSVPAGADLRLDSRQVRPGDAFLACAGEAGDGRAHIEAAVKAGAAAIVYDSDDRPAQLDTLVVRIGVPALAVPGLRYGVGELASAWYGHPSRQLAVIAVTGTNGKTSCTQWLAQALNANGRPCGVIGTLGVRFIDGAQEDTGLTTPDVVSLHRLLHRMVQEGAVAAAIEASSIGLAQGRLASLHVAVAAFTNLTRDHLDAHGDMATYEAAKALLFSWPELPAAVINLDDPAGARLAAATSAQRVLGYTRQAGADSRGDVLSARDISVTGNETLFTLGLPKGDSVLVRSAIPGLYNIENMLLVAGVLRVLGLPSRQIGAALQGLQPVAGRLQVVDATGAGVRAPAPMVVVDYAHTPDALQGALAALRPMAQARAGKLICVFGCGGNRDPGKRAPMGRIASESADQIVITSDNPRGESPLAILNQIREGVVTEADVATEVDRALAIMLTIWRADPTDVVLIAGKGHETTQEIAGTRHPFSDVEWARAALVLSGASLTTDSRTVGPGEVFVALKGERFDGHAFLDVVAGAGAVAALVEQPMAAALPTIALGDPRQALLKIGAAWRRRYAIPVIGVTGSNGKTTTKEMIAAILRAALGAGHVLATRGNLNNEIGVPLTLLRLSTAHRAAVIELGMNHPGEIAQLADAAAPSIALVNNAQREHQEFMHTVEAVARENGAVLSSLPADGVAVYPADDTYSAVWDDLAGERPRLRFGIDVKAEITAFDIQSEVTGSRFVLRTPQGDRPIALPVAGAHNVRNALAAAACALAAGCDLDAIARGLGDFAPVQGRMQSHRLDDGSLLIDDTYNANPDSVRAAIVVLAAMPGARRVLVLGDMGEVGDQGPAMHAEVGQYARQQGVDTLLCLGDAARDAADAFGAGALHFDSLEPLAQALVGLLPAAVLVKGSRFMRMERVVAALAPAVGKAGGSHVA